MAYGGRKGHSAARRLARAERELERSGVVERMLAEMHANISASISRLLGEFVVKP